MTKCKFQPIDGYTIPENGIELITERKTMAIRYDIAMCETETNEDGQTMPQQYEANFVRLPKSQYNYEGLVSAIITDKYTMDAQIAMLANKDDGNEEHQTEYAEYEEWRSHAKEVARKVIG